MILFSKIISKEHQISNPKRELMKKALFKFLRTSQFFHKVI